MIFFFLNLKVTKTSCPNRSSNTDVILEKLQKLQKEVIDIRTGWTVFLF